MEKVFSIRVALPNGLYLKDPQESILGRKILRQSIILLDDIGFEAFTFKKLAAEMGSTQASVYRYFENKHFVLLYLVAWYWEWQRLQIRLRTLNMDDAERKLRVAIEVLVNAGMSPSGVDFIDLQALQRIVIAESIKVYHTKMVDEENKEGFFLNYKGLSGLIASFIREYASDFPYPRSLATSLLELCNNQLYFAQHLPSLTDIRMSDQYPQHMEEMLHFYTFGLLDNRASSR